MMKILTIGDVHGRDYWKDLTHGSTYDFAFWKNSVDAGAPAEDEFWNDMPFMSLDKIIFVGDYTDSFDVPSEVIKNNLQDIIYLKKALSNKVVTLLGNHDIQYIVPNQHCTGFRGEMAIDLKQIFQENKDLFKIAHIEISNETKWLWTHAGVTIGWYKEAKEYLLKPDRFHAINRSYANKEIDEMINWVWESNNSVLYQIDRYSGGDCKWASPIWVRPSMLEPYPLAIKKLGYMQVVGHTPCKKPYKSEWVCNGKEYSIHYVDCLASQQGLILEI